jgi:hypothetical protein
MIHVDFNPEELPPELQAEWDQLQAEVESATRALILKWEQGDKLEERDLAATVWRDMKNWLSQHVFHGKCAYCETNLKGARQSGDAEHYRPKLKVNYKANDKKSYITPRAELKPGQMVNHPGYFWLAYHWKNLLPSCKLCNAVDGKKNQFPTRRPHVLTRRLSQDECAQLKHSPYASPTQAGVHYLQPDDLDAIEEPLLLHPYNHQPEDHLVFDEFGNVVARSEGGQSSEMGQHSIDVYDLDAGDLVTNRHSAQERAQMLFDTAVNYLRILRGLPINEARQKAIQEEKIAEILQGKAAYSAAQVAYLKMNRCL